MKYQARILGKKYVDCPRGGTRCQSFQKIIIKNGKLNARVQHEHSDIQYKETEAPLVVKGVN